MKKNNHLKYVTCADIGGSHVTAAVIDISNWSVVKGNYVRKEVNSKGSQIEILEAWIDVIKSANEANGSTIQQIALAMPGPFDYDNGFSHITGLNKYESIFGLNIRQLLAENLGIAGENIRFRNDAESTIAGEVLCGAGKEFKTVMGITLGTGFGSALFSSDQCTDLNLGSHAYRDTIADDYFSTRWFVKNYFEKTSLLLIDGVRELSSLSKVNNTAKRTFREFAANITEFLAVHIDDIKPETLLVCGNIAKAYNLFLPYLGKHLNTLVVPAQLGELAPLIGAAALFHPDYTKNQPLIHEYK